MSGAPAIAPDDFWSPSRQPSAPAPAAAAAARAIAPDDFDALQSKVAQRPAPAHSAADLASLSSAPSDDTFRHQSRLFSEGILDAPGFMLALPTVAAWDVNDIAGRLAGKEHGLIPQGDRALFDPQMWNEHVTGAIAPRENINPNSFGDRLSYAGGSGVGGAVTMGGLSGLARGAGMSAIPEALVPQTLAQSSKNISSGLLGGLGSEGAATAADDVTGGNKFVRGAASLLGGLLLGGVPYAGELTGNTFGTLANSARQRGELTSLTGTPNLEGHQDIVSRILNSVGHGGNLEPEASGMPGQQLTTGQVTGNEGLLALEKSLFSTDPEAVGGIVRARADASRIAGGLLDDVQGETHPDQAPYVVNAGVSGALKASDKTERGLWDAIDPTNGATVPSAPFRNSIQSAISQLSSVDQRQVPKVVQDVLDSFNTTTSLGEVIALDKTLGRIARGMPAGGPEQYIVGQVQKALRSPLETMQPSEVDPGALQRWQVARDFTRQQKATFADPDNVRGILEGQNAGDTMKFVVPPGPRGADMLGRVLKADSSPETIDAIRSHVVDQIRSRALTASSSSSGQRIMSPAQYQRALDQYDYAINDPRLFSNAQRNVISGIRKGLDQANRIGNAGIPGGSDTALKLAGNSFVTNAALNEFSGGGGGVGAGVGTVLGGLLGVPPEASSVMGGYLGDQLAAGGHRQIRQAVENVHALLKQALADPALAKALMQRATQANLNAAPERIRPLLLPYLAPNITGIATAVGNRPNND